MSQQHSSFQPIRTMIHPTTLINHKLYYIYPKINQTASYLSTILSRNQQIRYDLPQPHKNHHNTFYANTKLHQTVPES